MLLWYLLVFFKTQHLCPVCLFIFMRINDDYDDDDDDDDKLAFDYLSIAYMVC